MTLATELPPPPLPHLEVSPAVIEASAAVPAVAAAAVVVAAAAAAAAAASSSNQQQQDIPPLAGSGRNRNKMRKGSR